MIRSEDLCFMEFGSDWSDRPGTVIGEKLFLNGSSVTQVGPTMKCPGPVQLCLLSISADKVPDTIGLRGGQGRMFSRGQFTGSHDGRPVVIFFGSCRTLISVNTASVMPANGESISGVPKSSFSLGAGVGMAMGDDGSGMELAELSTSS